ncbi:MAG: NADH-quinone oxidoreductase subunit L [Akkermansiaceae bacterium]|nr:NADH-quinone oxidoreductase subunit L [Armatimonadota bacterium]
MNTNALLLWAIPALPLLGYLINAFFGAGLVKSPKPVIETEEAQFAASLADPHRYEIESEHDPVHVEGDGHTDEHDQAALDKGGMGIVGGLATAAVFLSFVLSILVSLPFFGGAKEVVFSPAFQWMSVPAVGAFPGLDLNFRLAVDSLTSLMLLIITGVGSLIHLYSMGYMANDKGYARYFGYLNLFVFFMLLLVMGSNLIVTFVGWEGVGLASYLLIGYWADRKSATDAGKKAFIVNRIGDAAFLVALFLLYKYFGTFELFGTDGILTRASTPGGLPAEYLAGGALAAASFVPFLMFIGATGKSAQAPLYVWLPDAMEGPTPVSALIHAATMVTGGVFLLARSHPLLLASTYSWTANGETFTNSWVMTVIAVVGISTAFLAATIALVQNDIKKVLAYSTVSQLGYMFLAIGVGAFGTAMFHVMTHAFFKALLFLCAGSVIHALGGEQDMRRMGGLWKKIPITAWTMAIGTVAIAGIPPFAGFFSKDEILANAFGHMGSPLLWATGVIVSGMTAFYMFRMMMKTFAGTLRYSEAVASHIHESPGNMTLPLMVLAVLSVVGGFFGGFAPLGIASPFENFLGASVAREGAEAHHLPLTVEWILIAVSVAVAIGGSLWAYNSYKKTKSGQLLVGEERENNTALHILENKWGVDGYYDKWFVEPGRRFANFLWRGVDVRTLDSGTSGVGAGIRGLAEGLKGWQSGYVRNYAFSMFLSIVFVVVLCLIAAWRAQAN